MELSSHLCGEIHKSEHLSEHWKGIVAHEKVRLFVSHCGLNSLVETSSAAVPMLCIPLYGDQMRNAKIAKNLGIAHVLDKTKISIAALSKALRELLFNSK